MEEQKTGFLEEAPGVKSSGRLFPALAITGGLIIFAISCALAVYKGVDIGVNIKDGCVYIITAGILGRAIHKGAEVYGEKKETKE